MEEKKRKIVVTSALPYANGDIHIGHLVEYIQTDFWVRFQKMRGNECVYVCADDTHGTPIMIRARKEGITPEELIARSHAEHLKDFTDFQIKFDNYYTTNSPENRLLSEEIYKAAEAKGYITRKTTPQLYCEKCNMFLPDRFVKGVCPKCGAADQYGDSCDKCGATYGAEELGSPKCTTCGQTPVVKDSEHLYYELEPQHEYLEKWIPLHTTSDVSNKLLEWFKEPLRGWCISRDAPYFGFEIPGFKDKYFYVWVDAPVGYIASLKNAGKFEMWNDPEVELYHFIGKDIIRFHCLFWPGMLNAAGFKGPTKVFVHGFLTVNGEKMSKSKGTFVSARTYLDNLPPEALRYYYAAKLGGTTDDMDLNLSDFVQRVNSDLVGKITNIASRGGQMLQKKLGGMLGTMDEEGKALVEKCIAAGDVIAKHYEDRKFNQAIVEICRLADAANEYFDKREPWKSVKTDEEATRTTLTAALNAFRIIAIYLQPVLPEYAKKAMKLFGESCWTWESASETKENSALGEYEYLASRIDLKQVDAMVEAAKAKPGESGEVSHESRASKNKDKAPSPAKDASPLKEEIAFPDFEKVDLRVGVVESCEIVPKSSKLLKFVLDAGALGKRTIFSGIRQAYPEPEKLVGKEVVFVANLAPRKMSVGVSEGMILFAGEPGVDGGVLSPSSPASGGTSVT
ncbi:MAG: methionine--tRNA ligase [Kiritimatiellae bacterium]|jgi:methionyl-tRNA synthetase|nr:methionine--tRNA ligase [Kiritimatiellia bacterium]